MTLDSLPDLEYKRVVSCKDSFHATDVLAVSGTRRSGTAPEHPRTIRRSPNGGRPRYPADPRRASYYGLYPTGNCPRRPHSYILLAPTCQARSEIEALGRIRRAYSDVRCVPAPAADPVDPPRPDPHR